MLFMDLFIYSRDEAKRVEDLVKKTMEGNEKLYEVRLEAIGILLI